MGGVRLDREHPLPQSVWTHFPDSPGVFATLPTAAAHGAADPAHSCRGRATVTSAAGVQRQDRAFDGDSFLGSRGGAKASVDFIYLAPVLGKGATVRDLCQVSLIQLARPVDGGGYLVHFDDLASKTKGVCAGRAGHSGRRHPEYPAPFASASQVGGLQAMPALGRRFGGNGDLLALWNKDAAGVSKFCLATVAGRFHGGRIRRCHLRIWRLPGPRHAPVARVRPAPTGEEVPHVRYRWRQRQVPASAADGRLRIDYDAGRELAYGSIRDALRVLSEESGANVWALKKPLTASTGRRLPGFRRTAGGRRSAWRSLWQPRSLRYRWRRLAGGTGRAAVAGDCRRAHHVADGMTRSA